MHSSPWGVWTPGPGFYEQSSNQLYHTNASTIYCHWVTPSPPRLMTESAHSGRFLHMKPVPTRAGVILSILPRYDAEKNIVASSELTISAHIYCSTDAPSETKSNERHWTSGVLSQEMLTPLRPLLIHFFKQEKMMMTHVLIATQAPKRPRNRVIWRDIYKIETVLKYHADAYTAVHAPIAVQKLNCIILVIRRRCK